MGPLDQLETALVGVNKGLPELPKNAKKTIVQYLPWLTLIIGVFTLWSAYNLYNWAHIANRFADWANSFSQALGGPATSVTRFTAMIWVSIAVLALEGAIYLLAFMGLRDNKKSGWNLLFLGAIINVAYGVIVVFTDYGSISNLFFSLIGSAIGFYFLFQIREYYLGKKIEEKTEAPRE